MILLMELSSLRVWYRCCKTCPRPAGHVERRQRDAGTAASVEKERQRGDGSGEHTDQEKTEKAVPSGPGGDAGRQLDIARARKAESLQRAEHERREDQAGQERRAKKETAGKEHAEDQEIRDPPGPYVRKGSRGKKGSRYEYRWDENKFRKKSHLFNDVPPFKKSFEEAII